MSKRVIWQALLSLFLATGCTYPAQQQPSEPTKTSTEKITVHGLSRDIISEARQIATEHCNEQNKQFTFMRNIFRKKTWLGMDWLTCNLYFACTAEGEQPPTLPAHHLEPDEIILDKEAHPETPKNEPAKAVTEPPDQATQPHKATAVLPKQRSPFDQDGVGEAESLGPDPLRPGDAQPSTAQDEGITVEILN